MKEKLTNFEQRKLNTYNMFEILEICRNQKLPHSIQSTSIIFYKISCSEIPIHTYNRTILIYAFITLACENENIREIMYVIENNMKPEDLKLLICYKQEIIESLPGNIYLPIPYYNMIGILITLQERNLLHLQNSRLKLDEMIMDKVSDFFVIEVFREVPFVIENAKILWNVCVCNMDRVLICDEYFYGSERECVLAAVPFELEVFNGMFKDVCLDRVKRIRHSAIGVKCAKKEEIRRLQIKLNKD